MQLHLAPAHSDRAAALSEGLIVGAIAFMLLGFGYFAGISAQHAGPQNTVLTQPLEDWHGNVRASHWSSSAGPVP